MVNRGVRIVNCGPSSDRACSPKDYIFVGRERERKRKRASYSFAKESKRVKSYMQRLYRPSGLLVARVTGDVHGTCAPLYIHCVRLLRYRSILRLERALISSSSKESACTFACWPCELMLSLFLSADFNADERRRCANMKGGCAERKRERATLSRG